jgi:hypothetical protein
MKYTKILGSGKGRLINFSMSTVPVGWDLLPAFPLGPTGQKPAYICSHVNTVRLEPEDQGNEYL